MRLARRTASVVVALVTVSGVGGCSSSGGSSAPAGPAPTTATAGATITIQNFGFSPATLTVHPGEQVAVVNKDSTAHTVTAATAGLFDTGSIPGGATKQFTAPNAPGTYNYICSIHQFMHGTLTVS